MQRAAIIAAFAFLAAPAIAQDDGGVTAPDGWTCTASYYGSDDGCDCGCGIPDPDCPDATEASCTYDWCSDGNVASLSDPTQCEVEQPAAPGWTCSNGYYGSDDGCDCGCGAPDPDCASNTMDACAYNGCDEGDAPTSADPTQCAPGEWSAPSSDDDADDDHGDNSAPPADDPSQPAEPSTPPASEPKDTSGVDLNDPPPARDEEPTASAGCTATAVEPALFAGLLLLGLRRKRR